MRSLLERIPEGGELPPEEVLDRFLGWVAETGIEPYAEQEEALLELMLDRHVVLGTPTGSGKSLVALGLHFKAMCEGLRSFYTAPVKALVSEKFFALCRDFGPEQVGMLTGDASINPGAKILCATTEVLASMALSGGEATDAPYAVLDEFHFYADPERGVSWQIPLLALPRTQFLLMSATLGNTAPLESRLRERTGREVTHVHSLERPVPLDYEYRETSLHQTLQDLASEGRAPVYVVHFTQRECGEQAQGLTSAKLSSREEKQRVAGALVDARFDTPYGRDLQRFLRHGIGVHHAGLLPRYRLLVEQLAGQGLLKVICGTDTLGVGVNIPIRTVVFTRLSKFDGTKVGILGVREFKQIAGRAGRKGFDDRGSVVCQAPEHVIENKRLAERAGSGGKKKPAKKRPAPRGFVPWNDDTFQKLVERPPEMLVSQFRVTHGMLVSLLQREDVDPERGGGYRELCRLIDLSHESDASKARHRRRAAELLRALRWAGIVEVTPGRRGAEARVAQELQVDFSLHHALSLYLVEAVDALDPSATTYPLEVLSVVESIQQDPRPILIEQQRKAKGELIARLKAEGVDYEDRMRQLDQVTWPRPEEEFIRQTFRLFADRHPWVGSEDIRPKSIAREMFESCRGFVDTVREYGIGRSEGLLLRYLSETHNTLVRSVPAAAQSDEVLDVIAFLRAILARVDASLIEAWQRLLDPDASTAPAAPASHASVEPRFDLAHHPKLLAARVRAELHTLVRALSAGAWSDAAACLRADPEDAWDGARLERELAPFLEDYGRVVFTPDARQARHTLLKPTGRRSWDVFQTLLDPAGDNLWALHGEVDLRDRRDPDEALVRLRRIGT